MTHRIDAPAPIVLPAVSIRCLRRSGRVSGLLARAQHGSAFHVQRTIRLVINQTSFRLKM